MNTKSILRYGRLLCIIFLSTLPHGLMAKPQEETGITLKLENATLDMAIEAIEQQSPYLFFNKGVDAADIKVNISVTDESIDNVCKALFAPLEVTYKIEGTYIYISKGTASIRVSGTLSDTYGNPLIGAAVLLKGTTTGASTGLDGKFDFELPSAMGGGIFHS